MYVSQYSNLSNLYHYIINNLSLIIFPQCMFDMQE